MLGIHDFGLFVLAGMLLSITPGPDTAYIVGRSVQHGRRGGAVAALGVGIGCLLHIVAAAVGLSALLAASATAFMIVKLAGAAYLIWLGLRMLLAQPAMAAGSPPPADVASLWQIFWQGALTNALNPKVALFFLAFLPQFVDAEAPHKGLAFLALGLVFDLNGTLWNLGVALATAKAAHRARHSRRVLLWINRALGGLFVAFGIRVAMAR
uniref:Lysine exporter protein (LYSE/YGGA) n=1 Tax=Rhodopseudomonas palustris (strain BisA53) TaxID=316055 RepID=Q07TS5_RHOP5